MNKSDNIMSMTYDEYKIFIVEYNKRSKYPDITKWVKISKLPSLD